MANVIVVDDDLIVLNVLSETVESVGHTVWRAARGCETMALIKGPGHFDLVVVDLVLKGESGILLIQEIRKLRPSLPVIAISGYISPESRGAMTSLADENVSELLPKPIDGHTFLEAVRHALEKDR